MMSFGERPATRDLWTYEGTAGEAIRLSNGSMGVMISVYGPDGTLLIEGNTPQVGPVTLPTTGTYSILVATGTGGIAGPYALTVLGAP